MAMFRVYNMAKEQGNPEMSDIGHFGISPFVFLINR